MSGIAVSPPALQTLVERMLQAAGSNADESRTVAGHLVAANVKGHDSHGIGMMNNYTDQLLNGDKSSFGCEIVPNDKPTVVTDTGPMLIYEAGSSFGQASARLAMEAAVQRAKEVGICMLGLRNANHIGRVGTYGEIATAAGMVSIHFVNVCECCVGVQQLSCRYQSFLMAVAAALQTIPWWPRGVAKISALERTQSVWLFLGLGITPAYSSTWPPLLAPWERCLWHFERGKKCLRAGLSTAKATQLLTQQ